ncbi:dnaJ protein ERDJ3A-like isoform X3 [Apium graveolens]|uniref:dnaJ protein ERDJ3A-like isoform X3 n=1 Tax=Apium graveolens TaxID=4045 RepID=UPI003D79F2BE
MMEFLRCFRYGDTHLGGDIFDKVLGVDKNASQREIQKAFHKLSFRYHPDKNNNKGTQEKFAEINNAPETQPTVESTSAQQGWRQCFAR